MSDMLRGGGEQNPLKKEHKQGKKRGVNRVLVLCIVGACVLLAAGGYFAATRLVKPPEVSYTPAPNTSIALVSRQKDEVVSVEITTPSSVLTVLREDDVYYAKEYREYKLNQSDASSLFYNAAAATADGLVEENAQDLAQYGLDNPASTAVARYSDGSEETFYVGSPTAAGTTYYLMRKGDPNVYIVWTNVAASFSKDIVGLRDIKLPELNTESIVRMLLERGGEETIELVYDTEKSYTINAWRFEQPFNDVSADAETVLTLSEGMAGVSYHALVGMFDDLSEFGLDNPRARFSVTDSDGVTIDWNVGGLTPDGYYVYVSPSGSNDVYRVSKSKLGFVDSTRLMQLVDTFANIINITRVDRVALEGSGERAVISVARTPKRDENGEIKKLSNGETDYEEVYSLDGSVVNTKATKTMYTSVIGTIIDGRVNEAALGDAAPVLTVDYTLNVEPYAYKVEYLPYDKDHYAVRVNGSTHFYLRKEKVDEIFTMLKQYRAGELDAEG